MGSGFGFLTLLRQLFPLRALAHVFVKLVRWQAGQRGSQVAMMRAIASRTVMKLS